MLVAFETPKRYCPSPGQKIDNYTVREEVGGGSFGTVYLVSNNTVPEKLFALKLLKLWEIPVEKERIDLIKRFEREFQTGKISSSYLVHTHDYGWICGNPYIVMQYCSNGDLRKKMRPGVPVEEITRYARNILLGLRDLHVNGFVHRDLKPDNVLLDDMGNALLTDFGIAGHRNIRMSFNLFGKPTRIFGTYAYMPPEQMVPPNKQSTILHTTDIFSFAVMMYELFTLKLPFGDLNDLGDLDVYIQNVKDHKLTDIKVYRKDIPAVWIKILEKCLLPDYKKRFQHVDEILSLIGVIPQQESPAIRTTEKIMMKVMQGEDFGKLYRISALFGNHPNGVLTIGRKDTLFQNDISLTENNSCYISRQHATLEKIGDPYDRYYLKDGQWIASGGHWKLSKNGTFINGTQLILGERTALKHGDIISIGDVTLKIMAEDTIRLT
jgi:hypothetical protein